MVLYLAYSVNKFLLSTYHMPVTVISLWDTSQSVMISMSVMIFWDE